MGEPEGAWIQTYTGKRFYPLAPREEDIDSEDIAHALSNLCRYTGHTNCFYSVAEHCVHVSRMLEPVGLAFEGLMHDAAEAYINDLARPLKSCPELRLYKAVEDVIEGVIAEKYGLEGGVFKLGQHPLVKAADQAMFWWESQELMRPNGDYWEQWRKFAHVFDHVPTIQCWGPGVAKYEFKSRFDELRRDKSSYEVIPCVC